MPSVTKDNPDLESEGPVINVHFLISSDLEKKYIESRTPIPEQVTVKALLDTGATCCMIQEDIPKKLGLEPVGEASVGTASQKGNKCLVYWIKMIIPDCDVSYEGSFVAISLEEQEVGCLIGRDFLKGSILNYMGNKNQFTLSIL